MSRSVMQEILRHETLSVQTRMTTLGFATALLVIAASAGLSAQRTPRTSNGRRDLQGIWLNNTATPLERLKDFADRAFFTEAEAREFEKHYLLDRAAAVNIDNPFELEVGADVDVMEPGHVLRNRRTSSIIDPPDGRIPALTPEARQRSIDQAQHLKAHYAENPEDLRSGERCLMIAGSPVGPPMLPVYYNNNIQIVQTEHYVMILAEMIHDARVISLDRRAHLPANIRQWKGDSIGHWEGDTLLVDTTNFTDKTTFRGSGSELHVVERFTLSDIDTLTYKFTIDDPSAFVRTWSAESAMSRSEAPMFEYACHEANYSMTNVLKGARYGEGVR
ncbi:MAG TPA: hypothetical protein VF456_26570 [Vicinamibacterales bacterium]